MHIQNQRFIKLFMTCALGFGLQNCGRDRNNSDHPASQSQQTPQDHNGDGIVDDIVIVKPLRGKWDGPCLASKLNPTMFEQTTMDFIYAKTYVRERRVFVDEKCQTALGIETEIGNYEIGGPIDQQHPDLYTISSTIQRLSLKPTSELGVANFNSAKLCGLDDWRLSATRIVTGVNCLGYTVSQHDVRHDLISIRNGGLYFGKRGPDANGRYDYTTRPGELDEAVIYHHR